MLFIGTQFSNLYTYSKAYEHAYEHIQQQRERSDHWRMNLMSCIEQFLRNEQNEKHWMMMMMMSFNCSFRNKNEPTAIYPLGTLHHGIKRHM